MPKKIKATKKSAPKSKAIKKGITMHCNRMAFARKPKD